VGFFNAHITLNNIFSDLQYKEPAFDEAVQSIIKPFSYKSYSLMRKELRTISVEPDVSNFVYTITIMTRDSEFPTCCIDFGENDARVMILVPPEKGRIPLAALHLYYNFRFFENVFDFFLNFDQLYNIANEKTKDALKLLYYRLTGMVK